MPRTVRASAGDICCHVLNRGNGRAEVFHDREDYSGFVRLMEAACERIPMRVLAFCLMPNHFHLCLWPNNDGDTGRWMQWLTTSHVRRYHRRYKGSGHVWQGRFKCFPIQQDNHLVSVLRYVERNPLRANLVERAEEWPWSSLHGLACNSAPSFLTDPPLQRGTDWVQIVNEAQSEEELDALRRCVNRGAPLGETIWVRVTASLLGLESTLRPRGRPKNLEK